MNIIPHGANEMDWRSACGSGAKGLQSSGLGTMTTAGFKSATLWVKDKLLPLWPTALTCLTHSDVRHSNLGAVVPKTKTKSWMLPLLSCAPHCASLRQRHVGEMNWGGAFRNRDAAPFNEPWPQVGDREWESRGRGKGKGAVSHSSSAGILTSEPDTDSVQPCTAAQEEQGQCAHLRGWLPAAPAVCHRGTVHQKWLFTHKNADWVVGKKRKKRWIFITGMTTSWSNDVWLTN